MKRWLISLSSVFILLILLLLSIGLTPMGLQIIARVTEKWMPTHFHYERITGIFAGPITITNLHFQNKNVHLDIDHLQLKWRPSRLLLGKFSIESIKADGVHISLQVDTFTQEPHISRWLPNVQIDSGRLTDVFLSTSSKRTWHFSTIEIEQLALAPILQGRIHLHLLAPYSVNSYLTLKGNWDHYQLQFSASNPKFHWTISGTGNRKLLQLTSNESDILNGHLSLKLMLQLGPNWQWKINLDSKHLNLSRLNSNWPTNLDIHLLSTGTHQETSKNYKIELSVKTPNNKIVINGGYQNQWQLQLNATINALSEFYRPYQGKIFLTGSIAGALESPVIIGSVAADNIVIPKLNLTTPMGKISFNFKTQFKQNAWQGYLSRIVIDSDSLKKWQFNQPAPFSLSISKEDLSITADLTMQSDNFNALPRTLEPYLKISGQWQSIFQVRGKLMHPTLSAEFKLASGSVEIIPLKIVLNRISGTGTLLNKIMNYHVTAYSGDELVHIDGNTKLSAPDYPTQLTLQGNNLLLINTNQYTVYASPNLSIRIANQTIDITGKLLIPRALLAPAALDSAVRLPDDVVFVGKGSEKISPWKLSVNITLVAGDNVMIDAFNGQGQLTGQLQLSKTATQPTIANGRIGILHGIFKTRKLELIIEPNSSIRYVNSRLDNPNLDVYASRQINTRRGVISAGLRVGGTLNRPNVSLYSRPIKLLQADILSYLIFGHPANINTPDNVNFLLQAVDQFRLNGRQHAPGGSADQITQALGISEFGLQSKTPLDTIGTPLGQEDNAYVLGRYISPRIYLRYSRGLIIPLNIIQIRYLLGVSWAVQTETSALGNGGDVLYTIQRP